MIQRTVVPVKSSIPVYSQKLAVSSNFFPSTNINFLVQQKINLPDFKHNSEEHTFKGTSFMNLKHNFINHNYMRHRDADLNKTLKENPYHTLFQSDKQNNFSQNNPFN